MPRKTHRANRFCDHAPNWIYEGSYACMCLNGPVRRATTVTHIISKPRPSTRMAASQPTGLRRDTNGWNHNYKPSAVMRWLFVRARICSLPQRLELRIPISRSLRQLRMRLRSQSVAIIAQDAVLPPSRQKRATISVQPNYRDEASGSRRSYYVAAQTQPAEHFERTSGHVP